MSLGSDNEEVQTLGKEILSKISAFTYASVQNLHDRYTVHLLTQIEGLDIETNEVHDQILLLSGVIRNSGMHISNIKTFQPYIILALKNTCPEGQVLIFKSIAESMLQWKDNLLSNAEGEGEYTHLKTFIEEVISPYLMWHAGRSAETVRTMATACLCATVQGSNQNIAEQLINTFSSELIPLIEDNSIRTRTFAVRILLSSGPLETEKLKPIIFQVSARLDDPCAEVRELAAICLGHLKPLLDEKEVWAPVADQIIERMVLHLESPEVKLKELLAASLRKIGNEFPEVYKKHLNALPDQNPVKKLLGNPEETKL